MKTFRGLSWLVPVALLAVFGCDRDSGSSDQTIPAGPTPAQQGLSDDGLLQIDEADRCPVCGMAPHKHPKFASAIVAGERTWYTCGTGCMLRANLHPEAYLGADPSQVTGCVTPDYFDGRPIDAATAWWVAGSDVVGPMGPALVALATQADLETFRARHGSRQVFRMAELDDEMWLSIMGKPALREHRPRGKDQD